MKLKYSGGFMNGRLCWVAAETDFAAGRLARALDPQPTPGHRVKDAAKAYQRLQQLRCEGILYGIANEPYPEYAGTYLYDLLLEAEGEILTEIALRFNLPKERIFRYVQIIEHEQGLMDSAEFRDRMPQQLPGYVATLNSI